MTNEEMSVFTREEKRELGKQLLWGEDRTSEEKDDGLQLLFKAQAEYDPEAMYIVGRLLFDGVVKLNGGNESNRGISLICSAARRKYPGARAFLNAYCQHRYAEKFDNVTNPHAVAGKLVDFDGKPIRIKRKGLFTPVDAVLENKNGENVLTLSTDVFICVVDDQDMSVLEQAVVDGIKDWSGEYVVFGGQKLRVDVNVTVNENIYDSVVILPMTKNIDNAAKKITDMSIKNSRTQNLRQTLNQRRSFLASMTHWTVRSRKFIMIYSEDDTFTDYDRMRAIAKHEFGHAIGLGDLYCSPSDSLPGVESGTYSELDSYAVGQKMYNLVMDDSYGPISNNDIEMVVLAFKENKAQNFQPSRYKGKISKALGRGN